MVSAHDLAEALAGVGLETLALRAVVDDESGDHLVDLACDCLAACHALKIHQWSMGVNSFAPAISKLVFPASGEFDGLCPTLVLDRATPWV